MQPTDTPPGATAHFLAGGGDAGALMRSLDWSRSPLGDPADWPQSLRTVVSLMLNSRFPMFVAWGDDLSFLYNDAYADILGIKHPAAMGARFREIWAEIWDDISPLIDAAMGGEATYRENLPLLMHRKGFDEATWFTFSYSPVRDEIGDVAGMFCACTETTAAVLAERAVRESEARFRNMADHAPVMMWVTDPDGACTYLNRSWYDYTGQAPRAGEGLGWLDAVHPDDRPVAQRAFLEANADRRDYRVDFRLRRADGSYRWTIDAAAARLDGNGDFLGYVGSVIDIGERKEMEDALRELNETLERRVAEALAERKLLADIVDGTDAFIQMVDRDFIWLAINRAAADEFESIFGVRPRVGDNMLDLLADRPGDQAAVRAVWERALGGESFTEIGAFGDPSRRRRIYEMTFDTLRDAEGRPMGAYQFVHDVTERIAEQEQLARAETARREADALYRAYFENTAEALFIVGVSAKGDFSLEEINPAHEAATGLQLAALRGKPLDEQLPPDVAREVAANYRRAVSEGRPIAYRERLAMPAGPRHWDTVLVPVRNAEGQIWRLIGSARDVTTQVLAEEQLRQSQKLEAMGSLVGGVAHDVNNLLSPIVGGLDLIQRSGVGDDRTRRLVDGAMQSAERARLLVQRLLAFARRQPLQAVAVDVGELVEGMADLVASTSGPRVRLALDIAPDLPLVSADANQLEMAVLNLSVNARDAMTDGGTLTLSVAREALPVGHRAKLPPGDYVRVAVSDTGIGMDAETARRAIEPFFSTKGIGRGTGLGLSMAHGLAAQLGGSLAIGSRPGLGTTIELWLPVAADGTAQPQRRETSEGPAGAGTALLVDDEELVRASTADMLADIGYTVVEAGSAEAALRLIGDGLRPDLLVTDHLMPGLSGTDLARELLNRQPGLRVLIVSGYADVEGVAPDLARLEKPFRRADLATAISALAPA